jgi:hypothetical protein
LDDNETKQINKNYIKNTTKNILLLWNGCATKDTLKLKKKMAGTTLSVYVDFLLCVYFDRRS